MPFLVRWPAAVEPGAVSDHLFSFTDIMATAASIVGHPMPEGAGPDSIDQSSVLLGQAKTSPRTELIIGESAPLAIRDGKWKFIPSAWANGFTPKPPKDVLQALPPAQLYDLEKDPSEQNNLHGKLPDLVKQLEQKIPRLNTND